MTNTTSRMITLDIDASVTACESYWRDEFAGSMIPGWTQGRYTQVTLGAMTARRFAESLRTAGVKVYGI